MAGLNPPLSSAVVEVSDDLVERYEAAGWTRVKSEPAKKSAPARSTSKSKK